MFSSGNISSDFLFILTDNDNNLITILTEDEKKNGYVELSIVNN